MPTIGWDEQIAGVRDNGTEHGIVSTEIKRGNLVAVPFRATGFSATINGSVTASWNVQQSKNQDGSGSGYYLAMAASTTWANSVILQFWIMGNVFGLRWDKSYDSSAPPIGVCIDGVAYDVDARPALNPYSQASSNAPGDIFGQVLATDLGDGPHFVELVFQCSNTGANRAWMLHGILVDAAAGYQPGSRCGGIIAPTSAKTVTTTATQLGSLFSQGAFAGCRKLIFINSTAGAIQASVVVGASNIAVWSRPVPANDSVEFDLGAPCPEFNALKVKASADTGLTLGVLGGY